MKKILSLMGLLVLVSIAISQTTPDKRKGGNDREKLTLEVELNKQECLPFEPITAKFRLSNKTGRELAMMPPDNFLYHTTLSVTDAAGNEEKITSLSLSSVSRPLLPGAAMTIQPTDVFEAETILPLNPGLFEKPGKYRLLFSFGEAKSDPLEITINQPSGIDKDAFEFLKRNGKNPGFSEQWFEEGGLGVLEEFVRRFSETAYGDYATSSLGRYYLYRGEPGKAKTFFERLINSEIKLLAEQSKKDLIKAENKLQQKSPDQ